MTAEKNLKTLMAKMQPALDPRTFVFARLPLNAVLPTGLQPQMWFMEKQGPTLIVEQEEAERHAFEYEFTCRMITLRIHSALDAVGFLAAVTRCLADLEMGVNPVSGFYHDHLFVPAQQAELAMQALRRLSQSYQQ
ncbi:ACT domain-containing protein [Lacimicrobium sp. SS2-24]|uniref:ACT domain-containing protein n=1 Tax=Lacimicrobium sp. SS2-24 TaxID=2005569 RepID=UPI000B4BF635|nr:ACT domain-containing protein [Lacimicrobium sp. SS2-24]